MAVTENVSYNTAFDDLYGSFDRATNLGEIENVVIEAGTFVGYDRMSQPAAELLVRHAEIRASSLKK